jgi:DNA-binding transcriptional ArsR family regulator
LSVTEAHEIGATVGAWNALVRRARIGRDRKAAALVVSSYARANGTQIHCGVARLAVDLECSHRTARRYLAWLRDVGLVELVREGNRRRGHSDEYRLILRPDVLSNLQVPDPAVYMAMVQDAGGPNQGSPKVSHDDHASPTEDQGSSLVSHDDRDQGSNRLGSGVTLDDPPPTSTTSQGSSTSQADDEELRTDVAVGGGKTRGTAVVVELFPGAAQEPPYRPPPGATRAQAVVAEAMARRAAARAAHAQKEAT